jgi:hypothetical protein
MEGRIDNVRRKQTDPTFVGKMRNINLKKNLNRFMFLWNCISTVVFPTQALTLKLGHSCIYFCFQNVIANYENSLYIWPSFTITNLIFTNWRPWPSRASGSVVLPPDCTSKLALVLINRDGPFTSNVDLHITVVHMNKLCYKWDLCNPGA